VSLGRGGERHPLEPVLNELKRYLGDVWVDLAQTEKAEGRQFVDALLDSEPNRLGEGFRQALFRHTGGHPLFTIELLREMQERGDLIEDEGRWVEGPTLNWGALPARVQGVIEERIGRQLLFLFRFRHSLFQKYVYDQLTAADPSRVGMGQAARGSAQGGGNPAQSERAGSHRARGGQGTQVCPRGVYYCRDPGRRSPYREKYRRSVSGPGAAWVNTRRRLNFSPRPMIWPSRRVSPLRQRSCSTPGVGFTRRFMTCSVP